MAEKPSCLLLSAKTCHDFGIRDCSSVKRRRSNWTCDLRRPSLSAHLIRQDCCHNRLGPALAQYGVKWNPSWVSAGSNGQQQAEGAIMWFTAAS